MSAIATAKFTRGNLSGLLAKVGMGLYDGVSQAAQLITAEAQNLVPVDTGELQGSIGYTVTRGIQNMTGGGSLFGVQAGVAATAQHAQFVEFGTGIVGSGTYPYPLPSEGVPITGGWQYDYKGQGWHGMKAQPYMRPALDNQRSNAEDAIRSAVQSALS